MKKGTVTKTVKFILVSLAAVAVLAGLSACSLLQGESVDGNWTSPTAAKDMYDEMLKAAGDDVFTYSDHSIEEIITKGEVNLDIKDDKASFEVKLHVDDEAFFKALKDEQDAAVRTELEKQGLNYDALTPEEKAELNAGLQSDEMIREWVSTAINELADEIDGTYSADENIIHTNVFKADFNRSSKTFEITEIGSAFGDDIVKEGESYQYTYKDGKLTLEGEKDEDDMVFEKKK